MSKKPWIWSACRSTVSTRCDAHRLQHVGHHLGGDRHARRARAAVLAGIAEIGDRGGDAAGGGALQRIDHDDEFHQVVVGRRAGRLQDEDILAADVLQDFDIDLAVGEAADRGRPSEMFRRLTRRRPSLGLALPVKTIRLS
jgi:hypothetical protein